MPMFLFGLVLAAVTFAAISLQKTYSHIPAKELKRRARDGDEVAALLYRAVGYGASLQMLLWLIVGVSAGILFVVWSRQAPTMLALIGSIAIVWVGFAWLPQTRVSGIGTTLARSTAPALAWILNRLATPLGWLYRQLYRYRHVHIHTGLYDKTDLLDLINQQNTQEDNRIDETSLQLAFHGLLFGDKLVRDIMVPRRVVKMVASTDSVGPILMKELHDSGHSRFPVYLDKPDNIVGTLYLRDLIAAKLSGQAQDIMSKKVYYVHDEQPLPHALHAFLKTKHHLFVVVNSFEEVVGIVTIEDIMEQIIGQPIVDEFDKYDDMRAVARLSAQKEHASNSHQETSAVVSEEKVVKSE